MPNALLHNLKHNKVLHENNLFLTVQNQEVPRVPVERQVEIAPLGHGCWQVILKFGFMDDLNVPLALQQVSVARWIR